MQWSGFTDRQERFLNDIFTNRSKDIFSGVSMMLFVFDVASDQQEVPPSFPAVTSRWIGRSTSKPWRSSTCTAPTRSSTSWSTRWTRSHSPKKPMFSLSSFPSAQKLSFYTEKATSISKGKPISVFGTSIWDETLYLVHSRNPPDFRRGRT